jgi:hypothetical protein
MGAVLFNILDQTHTTARDQFFLFDDGTLQGEPNPNFNKRIAWQAPFSMYLTARFEF